jgi:predicted transposase YdaD
LPGTEEGNFFEVLVVYYLKLVPIGREQFQAMVAALPSVKKPEVMMLYDAILEEGREKGLREGLEKGREEGLEKGLEKGLEEAKKRTILNGHKNGLSVDMLCMLTDYREDQVLRILAQIYDQTPD